MPDLDVQIRAYMDAASKPLTVDDVLGIREIFGEELSDDLLSDYLEQRPDERDSRPRGAGRLRAAIAVAATILAVAGVVLVGGDNGSIVAEPAALPTVTEPGPPSTVTEPLVPPTKQDTGVWTSVDGVTWSPVEEGSLDGQIDHPSGTVTVGGPGLVAIGSPPVGYDGAAVWTSDDGLSWSQVPHDEAVFADAWVLDVTLGGPGLVAVGTDYSTLPWSAAVWTSVDGVTWSRVPHDEAVFGGAHNQEMVDVTVGGPGLVAVGRDGRFAIDYTPEQVPAVWTSVDALTWSRVDPTAIPTDTPDSAMWSVTAGGPGLVAVGDGIWTSVDGATWTRATRDGRRKFLGDGVVDVTVGGPGLVAVGDGIWTSADGTTWSRADLEANFQDGFWSVTAGGPGLVAVKRLEG